MYVSTERSGCRGRRVRINEGFAPRGPGSLEGFQLVLQRLIGPGVFLNLRLSVSPSVAGGAGSSSRTKGKPTVLPFARRLHVYMTTMTCGVLYTTARLNVGVMKEIEHHWLYPAGHENRLRVRNLL